MGARGLLLLVVALTACSSKPTSSTEGRTPYADNVATEYVKNLQADVRKAKAAAEAANRRIAATDRTVEQIQDEAR